ncbi:MAG: hypothetical protein ACXWCY_20820, partial [Burkholderiales bacterium]
MNSPVRYGRTRSPFRKLFLLIAFVSVFGFARAADVDTESPADHTPPRLSLIEGQASFWRPGDADWTPARVNTPLAPGDALYTADRTTLEVQIGPRAFVRAAEKTQLSLLNFEADFLQFKLTIGNASLDLRGLSPGYTVELDTPNAVITVEHPGYYRFRVDGDATHIISRRGGRATITLGDGVPQNLAPSEETIVRGTAAPRVETYAAPEL